MEGIVQIVGATGFIGRYVFNELEQLGTPVFGVSRKSVKFKNLALSKSDLEQAEGSVAAGGVRVLSGARVLVFCAGLAHVQKPTADELDAFDEINADLPLGYAQAAILSGVKRFIYISSIGVHGDDSGEAFYEASRFRPVDAYARSKVLAEEKLQELLADSGVDLVIVRPPMVYGPEAPGNYARLVSLVQKGWPLPFGGLHNRRSFISIQNLVSFLLCCIDHPDAGGQVFVVSDNDDTTTCDFVREIAAAQGRSVTLLPVPRWLFVAGLALIGQGKAARKLSAPLTIDCTHAMKTLEWHPPYSLREGVRLSFVSSQ